MDKKNSKSNRIVIFDDSKEALERFDNIMKQSKAEILQFRSNKLNELIIKKIQKFKPQLFVVDLLLGESKVDGYNLIKQINRSEFKDIPIVVCSKLIGETVAGESEREQCRSMPGVVAAFSKFPNFPSPDTILRFIKKEE